MGVCCTAGVGATPLRGAEQRPYPCGLCRSANARRGTHRDLRNRDYPTSHAAGRGRAAASAAARPGPGPTASALDRLALFVTGGLAADLLAADLLVADVLVAGRAFAAQRARHRVVEFLQGA